MIKNKKVRKIERKTASLFVQSCFSCLFATYLFHFRGKNNVPQAMKWDYCPIFVAIVKYYFYREKKSSALLLII